MNRIVMPDAVMDLLREIVPSSTSVPGNLPPSSQTPSPRIGRYRPGPLDFALVRSTSRQYSGLETTYRLQDSIWRAQGKRCSHRHPG
jgi:hypothetical protein